jgi:hypothetical protein
MTRRDCDNHLAFHRETDVSAQMRRALTFLAEDAEYAFRMDVQARLERAAADAKAAIERGDNTVANEAWERYELISAAMRPPSELLAETIALSEKVASIRVIGDRRS